VQRVSIVVASGQNVFFDELLTALGEELRAYGVDTERATDHFPAFDEGTVYLFVPHEYYPLTMADAYPSPAQLRRTVALCTEQPGTHWFDEAAAVAGRAGAVVDINSEGATELRRRGIAARVLRLGWTPTWDRWGGDEGRARPTEVAFLGSYTPRRAKGIARCAGAMAGRRCFINLSDATTPNTLASGSFLAGERKWDLLASSRVLLNIHRSELGYLEWQRVVEAISNGCVLLTEHSLGAAPLVPGDHYVSSSYENLPEVLAALLGDPGRLARIRRNAYALLREELPLSASIGVLLEALGDAAATSVEGLERGLRRPRPRPLTFPGPLPEYERLARDQSDASVMRMALKQLVLTQKELRRQLQAHEARADVVEQVGDPGTGRPRVSVVMTVFNYAHTVGDAVGSVAGSEMADLELVVVDDASTDDSVDQVRAALDQHPSLPATLVLRGSNQGLPRARNAGVEQARGEYIFILDADNAIYPHCLGRLADTLDADPSAAFAYGILEVFDAAGHCDLMSWRVWDPQRLRHGNYVDAMAMIRRTVLTSVGGYPTDPRLYGWEDFALWCTLADRGWRGIRVPEIVARYRRGLQSMISVTDIDGRDAWSALLESHPILTAEGA
jgi:hypothetical protein